MRNLITALALMTLAACQPADRPGAGSVWSVDTIAGVPFTADATLTFGENGALNGKAPCNSFAGRIDGAWPDIRLGGFRATLMACPQLAAEAVFFTALATVRHGEMIDGRLVLSSGSAIVMELSAQD